MSVYPSVITINRPTLHNSIIHKAEKAVLCHTYVPMTSDVRAGHGSNFVRIMGVVILGTM